jgi:hypothetical protein
VNILLKNGCHHDSYLKSLEYSSCSSRTSV